MVMPSQMSHLEEVYSKDDMMISTRTTEFSKRDYFEIGESSARRVKGTAAEGSTGWEKPQGVRKTKFIRY